MDAERYFGFKQKISREVETIDELQKEAAKESFRDKYVILGNTDEPGNETYCYVNKAHHIALPSFPDDAIEAAPLADSENNNNDRFLFTTKDMDRFLQGIKNPRLSTMMKAGVTPASELVDSNQLFAKSNNDYDDAINEHKKALQELERQKENAKSENEYVIWATHNSDFGNTCYLNNHYRIKGLIDNTIGNEIHVSENVLFSKEDALRFAERSTYPKLLKAGIMPLFEMIDLELDRSNIEHPTIIIDKAPLRGHPNPFK